MPATDWRDVVGSLCCECGRPATHIYGGKPLCCQCHGGNVVSIEEARRQHDGELARLRQAADHKIERNKRYVILVKDEDPRKIGMLRDLLGRFLESPEPTYLVLSGQHYEVVLLEELSGDIAYIIENIWEE